jgi:hypothetical protein
MAKKVASFRLEVETVEAIGAYAKERHCSQAEVVEMGWRALREDARGGVPDLPEKVEAVKQQVVRTAPVMPENPYAAFDGSAQDHIRWRADRQARLNAAKDRAS